MTDEPNDQLGTLASAYLDGEASPEELARVEADVDALAEVDRLRQIRALVADVEPAAISRREAHLSAALDAWDRLPDTERDGTPRSIAAAGVDPITAAAVSSMSAPRRSGRGRQRTRSNGWIMAAAAGLVVLLAGGLTLRSLTGDDTDDTSTAVETDQNAATAEPEDGESSLAAIEGLTTDPSLEPSADIADTDTEADVVVDAPPPEDGLEELENSEQLAIYASDALDDNGEVLLPDTAPATERTLDDASSAGSAEETADADTDAPSDADAPAADNAESATEAQAAPALPAVPAELPLCNGADYIVGPALYDGQQVVVAIDVGRDRALAYRADDCAMVAQVQLP
jgi:hypothetical protein